MLPASVSPDCRVTCVACMAFSATVWIDDDSSVTAAVDDSMRAA